MWTNVRTVPAAVRRIQNINDITTAACDSDRVAFTLTHFLRTGCLGSQRIQCSAAVTSQVVTAQYIPTIVGAAETAAVILSIAVYSTRKITTTALLSRNC